LIISLFTLFCTKHQNATHRPLRRTLVHPQAQSTNLMRSIQSSSNHCTFIFSKTAEMKNLITFIFFIAPVLLYAQQRKEQKLQGQIKQYWFVMLTKGGNRNQDSATAAKIQEEHLANINRLYKEGKLKVAGPFGDDGEWRGIFIFDVGDKQEVEQLLKTDPAIKSGRLNYEIHPWYTMPTGSFSSGKPKK